MSANIVSIFSRLLKNLLKHTLGLSPLLPVLTSNTMGTDDLKLCRQWLKQPDHWYDQEVCHTFNQEFARWNHSQYAFSFMGGRVALSACIFALALKPGDEVIVPGYTCVVVPNAFRFAGIQVVYADIELDTYGLDAAAVIKKIGPKTKAILIQHLYGLVCRDYQEILNIARHNNIYIIEDCAQSTGAQYNGKNIGNQGDVAIYSCEQSKAFTTGQGGIATTNDPLLGQRLQVFYHNAPFPDTVRIDHLLQTLLFNYYTLAHPRRWLLKEWAYHKYGIKALVSTTPEEIVGIKPSYYGCKMPAPLAAIALNQLHKLDHFNQLRRNQAAAWNHWCEQNHYHVPLVIPGSTPIFLRYPVLVAPAQKKDLSWAVQQLSLKPGIWFETHIHPADFPVSDCPNADQAVAQCINLPTLGVKHKK